MREVQSELLGVVMREVQSELLFRLPSNAFQERIVCYTRSQCAID